LKSQYDIPYGIETGGDLLPVEYPEKCKNSLAFSPSIC